MGLDGAALVCGRAKSDGLLRKSVSFCRLHCWQRAGHRAEASKWPACGQRGSWDRHAGQETETTSFGSTFV